MTIAPVTSVNVKQAVPFFGVSNMEASLRFYVDGLGFKMKHWWIPERIEDNPDWCWLELGDAAVKCPFVGNRLWVVPLIDPDGYRIEFESPSDAPEESELEE
jgi:lactoylglutathione lyase